MKQLKVWINVTAHDIRAGRFTYKKCVKIREELNELFPNRAIILSYFDCNVNTWNDSWQQWIDDSELILYFHSGEHTKYGKGSYKCMTENRSAVHALVYEREFDNSIQFYNFTYQKKTFNTMSDYVSVNFGGRITESLEWMISEMDSESVLDERNTEKDEYLKLYTSIF